MKTSSSFILSHIAAAIIVTILIATIYATVQQSHRSGANDPQLQIAREIAQRLSANKPVDYLFPEDTIDISRSLGLFVTMYDNTGQAIYSSAHLDGKLPQIPKGVLEFVKDNYEDVVTWQPRSGVRMAMVVEKVNAGSVASVAVGRSLQEVEIRESTLVKIIFISLVACLGIIFLHCGIQLYLLKKQPNSP